MKDTIVCRESDGFHIITRLPCKINIKLDMVDDSSKQKSAKSALKGSSFMWSRAISKVRWCNKEIVLRTYTRAEKHQRSKNYTTFARIVRSWRQEKWERLDDSGSLTDNTCPASTENIFMVWNE